MDFWDRMAQAILGFPEIIILDEPTVGLDPKQIIEIREMIRKLAKNHTVILSSHILAEVREVCDYIMIISSGKLVASDDPEKLEKKIGGEGFVEIQARATAEEVKGVPLLEITRTKTTLEEVFLELTQGKAVESEEQMYDSDI